MSSDRSSVRAAQRPLVALLAVAILMAPLLVAPAGAQARCGSRNGFWTSIPAPRFPAGAQSLIDHAVDARSPSTMYVTNGTAVMRTRDSGCNWAPVYVLDDQPSADRPFTDATAEILSVVVPEAVAGRVLLTVEETAVAATRPHVVVSFDRGASWQLGDSGLPPVGAPETLVVAPGAAAVAYLGLDLGSGAVDSLFASADGGVTWQPRSQRIQSGVTGLTVDPLVPTEVWAHGPGGLTRSTDGGTSFVPVDEFVGETAGPLDIFHAPGTAARIIAFVPSRQFMLSSNDGGETWNENYAPRGGTPDSVAHGAFTQSVIASSGGNVFGWAPAVFAWTDLNAPNAGVVDLVADRTATPAFYGRTARSIEIYRGPDGTTVIINDPDFDIGDVGSLIDIPEVLDPTPPHLVPETNKIRIPAGETRKQTYRLALSRVRTPLDVYLLIDTSSSAKRFLKGLAHVLADVVRGLEESRIDVHFGIGEYRAYPDSTPQRPRCDTPEGELLAPQCETNFVYRRVLDVQPVSQALAVALEGLEALGGGHYDAPLPALLQTATGAGDDLEPPGPLGHDVPPGQQANFRDKAFKVVINASDEEYRVSPYNNNPPDRPTFEEVIAALNAKGIHQIGLALGTGSLEDMRRVAAATGAVAPAAGVDCDGDGAADLSPEAALVCTVSQDTLEEGANLVPAIVNLVEAVRNSRPVTFTASGRDNVVADISPDGYPGVALQSNERLDFTVTYRCPGSMAGERTTIDVAARDGEGVLAKATTTVICGGVPGDPLLSVLGFDVLAAIPLIPVSPPPTIVEPASSAQAQSQAQAQGAMAQQRQEQHQVAFAHSYKAALREALARDEEYAMTAYQERTPAQVPARVVFAGAAFMMAAAYAYAVSTRTRLRYRFNRR